ncbi:MAG: hypothetical protein AAFY25_07825 [Pseudomonadota bacterium]
MQQTSAAMAFGKAILCLMRLKSLNDGELLQRFCPKRQRAAQNPNDIFLDTYHLA